jgi:hypothetical protein
MFEVVIFYRFQARKQLTLLLALLTKPEDNKSQHVGKECNITVFYNKFFNL